MNAGANTGAAPHADAGHRAFVTAFENLTLPKEQFKHGAHVRLAWYLLRNLPLPDAVERFADGLRRFAVHHGVPGLYHETITMFYVNQIAARLRTMPADHDWEDFRTGHTDLFAPHRELLERHYTTGTLDSSAARQHFLLPDRAVGKAAHGF